MPSHSPRGGTRGSSPAHEPSDDPRLVDAEAQRRRTPVQGSLPTARSRGADPLRVGLRLLLCPPASFSGKGHFKCAITRNNEGRPAAGRAELGAGMQGEAARGRPGPGPRGSPGVGLTRAGVGGGPGPGTQERDEGRHGSSARLHGSGLCSRGSSWVCEAAAAALTSGFISHGGHFLPGPEATQPHTLLDKRPA